MFDCVEETLHEIAFRVKRKIAFALLLAVQFWRNDGFDPAHLQALDEGVAIVSFVGKERFGVNLRRQMPGLGDVMDLTAGKADSQRIAKSVDDGVYLCGQSAA